MKKDHALIYQDRSLRNWPHRRRLREIRSAIRREGLAEKDGISYADFGCGTGFLTDIVAGELGPADVHGFDHSEHLDIARERYPSFEFGFIELNEPSDVGEFDFVTCFETLEHVGDMETALGNMLNATREGGTLLITAPIEIGPVGTIKFLAKTILYGYSLEELADGQGSGLYLRYLSSLLLCRDISAYRPARTGWGTHFGFDYRSIDRYLDLNNISFTARNAVTTRFYVIRP
jgi:SAM-dependent methyltransferase